MKKVFISLMLMMVGLSGLLYSSEQFSIIIKNKSKDDLAVRIREDKDQGKIYFNETIKADQKVLVSLLKSRYRFTIIKDKEDEFKIFLVPKAEFTINLVDNNKIYEITPKGKKESYVWQPKYVVEGFQKIFADQGIGVKELPYQVKQKTSAFLYTITNNTDSRLKMRIRENEDEGFIYYEETLEPKTSDQVNLDEIENAPDLMQDAHIRFSILEPETDKSLKKLLISQRLRNIKVNGSKQDLQINVSEK
jgi:hypothetical protein